MNLKIIFLLCYLSTISQITLELPTYSGSFKTTITLPVVISNSSNEAISAFEGSIFFDNDIINLTELRVNNNSIIFGKGLFNRNVNIDNEVRFAWAASEPFNSGGVLFDITIELISPGITELTTISPQSNEQTLLFNSGNPEAETLIGQIEVEGTAVKIKEPTLDENSIITVPIRVVNFFDVGSFSWRINFQNQTVSFLGIENIYQNLDVISNSSGSELNIGWVDMSTSNSINIDENKLLDLKFLYKGGETDLNFNSISEVTNSNGERINVRFEDGYIPNLTSLGELLEIPNNFDLAQNYPNPFNPSTQIMYSLPIKGQVKLTIFNVVGQKVTTLVNEAKEAGNHKVEWNAESIPSGVYFYTLNVNGSQNYRTTKKMLLVK